MERFSLLPISKEKYIFYTVYKNETETNLRFKTKFNQSSLKGVFYYDSIDSFRKLYLLLIIPIIDSINPGKN